MKDAWADRDLSTLKIFRNSGGAFNRRSSLALPLLLAGVLIFGAFVSPTAIADTDSPQIEERLRIKFLNSFNTDKLLHRGLLMFFRAVGDLTFTRIELTDPKTLDGGIADSAILSAIADNRITQAQFEAHKKKLIGLIAYRMKTKDGEGHISPGCTFIKFRNAAGTAKTLIATRLDRRVDASLTLDEFETSYNCVFLGTLFHMGLRDVLSFSGTAVRFSEQDRRDYERDIWSFSVKPWILNDGVTERLKALYKTKDPFSNP